MWRYLSASPACCEGTLWTPREHAHCRMRSLRYGSKGKLASWESSYDWDAGIIRRTRRDQRRSSILGTESSVFMIHFAGLLRLWVCVLHLSGTCFDQHRACPWSPSVGLSSSASSLLPPSFDLVAYITASPFLCLPILRSSLGLLPPSLSPASISCYMVLRHGPSSRRRRRRATSPTGPSSCTY